MLSNALGYRQRLFPKLRLNIWGSLLPGCQGVGSPERPPFAYPEIFVFLLLLTVEVRVEPSRLKHIVNDSILFGVTGRRGQCWVNHWAKIWLYSQGWGLLEVGLSRKTPTAGYLCPAKASLKSVISFCKAETEWLSHPQQWTALQP